MNTTIESAPATQPGPRTTLADYEALLPPRFLVTGTGRSGSKWISHVLTVAGIQTGHEAWWGLTTRIGGMVGEASWLGCFDDGYAGSVFLQARDPRTAIPSIYSNEFRMPYRLIREQNVTFTGDWRVDACRIWLDYNVHAANRSHAAWRLEDVDAATLAEIFAPWGASRSALEQALDLVPRDVNARPKQDFVWPDHPIVEECLAVGRALGYDC